MLMLYDDPGNQTWTTIASLLTEMASLFPDTVFHIGTDETVPDPVGPPVGNCTDASFQSFEWKLQRLMVQLGKR